MSAVNVVTLPFRAYYQPERGTVNLGSFESSSELSKPG